MLSTHSSPEKIVVCECFPLLRDLGCSSKGNSVEVAENPQIDFAREEGEWVDSNDFVELV